MALETQVIAGKSITFDPEVRDEIKGTVSTFHLP